MGDQVCDVGTPFDDDRELVAAESGHRVTGTNGVQQAVGRTDQQFVPNRMTEAVVDQLEVIEVDRDNANRAAVALAQLHGMVESLVEQGAVGQPGQRVAQRLVGDGDQ